MRSISSKIVLNCQARFGISILPVFSTAMQKATALAADSSPLMDSAICTACCGVFPFSQFLDAAVLVKHPDFEIENSLTNDAETEMPGFDDPGMHRADGIW